MSPDEEFRKLNPMWGADPANVVPALEQASTDGLLRLAYSWGGRQANPGPALSVQLMVQRRLTDQLDTSATRLGHIAIGLALVQVVVAIASIVVALCHK